ncbi:hypothetical protein ACF063_22635 [Streptomyces chartreusis]|uniref:hypothetical protein n=1 Tax=Streptomyces TaxID=1883 RepID=UPI001C337E24|nr:hypothetical protein KJK32_18535 [Streptomyces sp. JCM17656]
MATVLATAATAVVMGATTAHAGAYGCAGNQIDAVNVRSGGKTYGTLRLYWDGASGKNCAVMVKNNDLIPGTRYIYVQVSNSNTHQEHRDGQDYSWYAGPVRVEGRGDCVWASGSIEGYPGVATGDHCG